MKLFTITFVDDTVLWVIKTPHHPENLEFGTLGKGANLLVKEMMEKIPYRNICMFAENYSKSSQFVKKYVNDADLFLEEQTKTLIKAI